MSVKDAIQTRLEASAELVAIVDAQIYFTEPDRPDGKDKIEPPTVIFTFLEDVRLEALNDRRAVVRFDCVGKTLAQSQQVADIVEPLFDNFVGQAAGVRIRKSGRFTDAGAGVASRDERVGNWFNAPVGVSLIYLE